MSCRNFFYKAWIFSLITDGLICIAIYIFLVSLYFKWKIGYWSSWANEMSYRKSFVSVNGDFFVSDVIYVILLISIQFLLVSLNVTLRLRYVTIIKFCFVIFLRMDFMTCGYFFFLLEKIYFPLLIMNTIRKSSKLLKLCHKLIW